MSLKYRISSIGWYNFELLVQTLLKVVIGPGVTSFGGTKDGGRDAAFSGPASFPSKEAKWIGEWAFQVKYIDAADRDAAVARSSIKSTLRKELPSVLSRHNNIDNYILVTNVPLTAETRSELEKISVKAGFVGRFATVDGKEVCQFLDIYPEVRRSFPQLLGLADLDMIVNHDLYARSRAYLEQWQPRLATYVHTEAHAQAVALLKKKHFIVLDGPPEAGKTTIAAAIALLHATEGFEIIDTRVSNDLFKSPDDLLVGDSGLQKPKLFIADDAIGSVSLEPHLADGWSRDLPGILRKLNGRRLLVWTARRYILEEALAKSRLKDAISDFPHPNEVLVEVGKLTVMQKAEILYNHAKAAKLTSAHRKLIRAHATTIIMHPNFSPLRIEQLMTVVLRDSDQAKTSSWEDIAQFLANPGERWIQAYRTLSGSEQKLLSAMLDCDEPASVKDLRSCYESRVAKQGDGRLAFDDALNRLNHSFLVASTTYSGEKRIAFQHPSLRDLLLLELRGDPSARVRYFAMATPFALSGIIGGIANTEELEGEPQHAVVPTNDQEFNAFLNRLQCVSQEVLKLKDWELLLASAERLIPSKPSSMTKSPLSHIWRELGIPDAVEFVDPSDIDLSAFATQPSGRIFRAILEGFALRRTFENSQRFSESDWCRLLTKFYRLTMYVSPPVYPTFSGELCQGLSDSIEAISLANEINNREPIVLRQNVGRTRIEEWKERLACDAASLTETGNAFDDTDDPDEFDQWKSDVDELVGTSQDFLRWSGVNEIGPMTELEEVKDSAERPIAPEPDDEYREERQVSGPYWTIDRMFEDL